MKPMSMWSKAFLIVTLAASALSAFADQPASPPPRGNAYGYRLQDGAQVLFVYLDSDGSRIIDISMARPRSEYLLEASEDLVNWNALAVLRIQSDGTATYVDTMPAAHCFYRVTRVR